MSPKRHSRIARLAEAPGTGRVPVSRRPSRLLSPQPLPPARGAGGVPARSGSPVVLAPLRLHALPSRPGRLSGRAAT